MENVALLFVAVDAIFFGIAVLKNTYEWVFESKDSQKVVFL